MAGHFAESDIAEFFEVFRQYDREHDGLMEVRDVAHAMIALGHNPTEQELSKLIWTVKHQSEGCHFDFPEFLSLLALHIHEMEPEEQMIAAFKVFDKDGKGSISASELKASMASLGERLSQEDIDYMITVGDRDGDGRINYEEFIRFMTSD